MEFYYGCLIGWLLSNGYITLIKPVKVSASMGMISSNDGQHFNNDKINSDAIQVSDKDAIKKY